MELYFIRLTDNKKAFVHPISMEPNEQEYTIKEQLAGAAMFQKQNGLNFIEQSGAGNLELVDCKELLKT